MDGFRDVQITEITSPQTDMGINSHYLRLCLLAGLQAPPIVARSADHSACLACAQH